MTVIKGKFCIICQILKRRKKHVKKSHLKRVECGVDLLNNVQLLGCFIFILAPFPNRLIVTREPLFTLMKNVNLARRGKSRRYLHSLGYSNTNPSPGISARLSA